MQQPTEIEHQGTDPVVANLEWVRALSVRLVRDAASADDLVQRAWVAAQGGRPRRATQAGVRAWLGGILRNLAREEGRSAARRRRREVQAFDGPREANASDDLLARSEQLAEVAQLVLDLEEPFRRTMLLRWFDGLTPAQIARQEEISSGTVRTRLHRGLSALRASLDGKHGGRTGQWALTLVPFAARDAGASSGPVASTPVLAAVLALAAVGGGLAWWQAVSPGRGSVHPQLVDVARGSGVKSAAPADADSSPALVALPGERVELVGAATLAGEVGPEGGATTAGGEAQSPGPVDLGPGAVPGAASHVLRGQVVLVDGTPLAYVSVRVELEGNGVGPGATQASDKSDENGFFEINRLQSGSYRLRVLENGEFPVVGSSLFGTRIEHQRVEVRGLLLELRALDPLGAPVPMGWVRQSEVWDKGQSNGGLGAVEQALSSSALTHELLVPAGVRYLIAAGDEGDDVYFGLAEPSLGAGKVRLDLVQSHPALGSLRVEVESADLPRDAKLVVESSEHADLQVWVRGRHPSAAKAEGNGRSELHFQGLLPGTYSFRFDLEGAGPVALVEDRLELQIDAGIGQSVTLESMTGGVFELHVSAALPLEERALGEVSLRRAGDVDWFEPSLVTHEEFEGGTGTMRGPSVLIDGAKATSVPMAPGEYEVRVAFAGHRSALRKFRLLEAQTEVIEVTLCPR